MLALGPEERERLLAVTSPVSLEPKQILLIPGGRIDTVYFPDNAVVSLLRIMDDGTTFEVANIGNEGIVGVSAFLGIETLGAHECYQVEVPGQARAMDVASCEALPRLLRYRRNWVEAALEGAPPVRGIGELQYETLFDAEHIPVQGDLSALDFEKSITLDCSEYVLKGS